MCGHGSFQFSLCLQFEINPGTPLWSASGTFKRTNSCTTRSVGRGTLLSDCLLQGYVPSHLTHSHYFTFVTDCCVEGRDIVMEWRRSYDARPPLMTDDHPHFATINADPRYRHLTQQQIRTTDDDDDDRTVFSLSSSSSGTLPRAESLADCQVRVVEAWKDVLEEIRTEFDEGSDFNYSLLVAHANTLRALVQYLDGIPVREIEGLNIPTGMLFCVLLVGRLF